MSLNAIASPAALDPWPLVTLVRRLTVAKADLHGPGAGQHRAWPGGPVAHRQAAAVLIAHAGELADAGGDLGLQRSGQHLPGTFADDLVDQRR
jgi:hypothetical protein